MQSYKMNVEQFYWKLKGHVTGRRKMENVVKQLKQFKADAIYEKKKHYNAAERKRTYYKWISIIQIVLNAISGTTLLTVVFGNGSKTAEILALVFTIIATVLASVQKIGDFENQAQGNSKVADMYLEISKNINQCSSRSYSSQRLTSTEPAHYHNIHSIKQKLQDSGQH